MAYLCILIIFNSENTNNDNTNFPQNHPYLRTYSIDT